MTEIKFFEIQQKGKPVGAFWFNAENNTVEFKGDTGIIKQLAKKMGDEAIITYNDEEKKNAEKN